MYYLLAPSCFGSTANPPFQHGHLAPLSREETQVLGSLARRIQQMMSLFGGTRTRAWPHAVRDERGYLGMFIWSERPFLSAVQGELSEAAKRWVILGVVAAAKYLETSSTPVDFIAFTDSQADKGQRWYLEIDIDSVRNIHRRIVKGYLDTDEAFPEIERAWKKITAPPSVASR